MELNISIRTLCVTTSLLILCGCMLMGKKAFEDAYGRSMIGVPIEHVFPTHGQPERIEPTDQGTAYYVYPLRRLGKCTVYWEVAAGKIVSMKHEGKDCVKGPFND